MLGVFFFRVQSGLPGNKLRSTYTQKKKLPKNIKNRVAENRHLLWQRKLDIMVPTNRKKFMDIMVPNDRKKIIHLKDVYIYILVTLFL